MKKVAIIPLRAGSKGIPNKNKKRVLGKPLFTWVLGEAIQSELDQVFIYTDDQWIIDYVNSEYSWTKKVRVIERSEESASDTASTEFAMMEFASKINFDVLVLLQATSPLTSMIDINKACTLIEDDKIDSVLSVVKTHRFIWTKDGKSINYDFKNRPRRQDFEGLYIENGAVYACKKEILIKEENRLGGNIEVFEMNEDTLVEIDEPIDFLMVEKLLENRLVKNKSFDKIKALIIDVDGVFTNGKVATGENGEISKEFSLIDGMGLEILREENVFPVVLTSENSMIVKKRMEKLKIEHVFTGIRDKFSFLDNFLNEKGLTRAQIAYIGDDINDLANICGSGLSFCPDNAVPKVKMMTDNILKNKGSEGAIREACEYILKFNRRS
jgi:N-acylneuraminate cytidylyltransferase